MNALLDIINTIKLDKKFINSNLVEKSFKDWSQKYLDKYSSEEYIDSLYNYFRIIESIDMEEIESANRYKKMERMHRLFDKLQLACEPDEQKIFAIEELKSSYYPIHPFIFGLMLHFYDLKFSEEIDEKITYLTQWIEDIAYKCDTCYQKELKKN